MFDPKSDMSRLNFDALDRKLGEVMAAQGRAVLFVNDPCQNPTGYSMNQDDWRSMVDVIGRHASRGPVAIVLDAAYAAYAKEGMGTALRALESLLGRALVMVAWSASKTFTHYGLRVGALVVLHPDEKERKRLESALGYACRGTWSNCNRGGMTAVTRLLREPALAEAVASERKRLVALLDGRVAAFNELARPRRLRYPRYDGGFFVTIFVEDAPAAGAKMKEDGVFVVPLKGALRVALCSVAVPNIPRLVDSLEKTSGIGAHDV
jgi:aromatic-amino-acid transaminase